MYGLFGVLGFLIGMVYLFIITRIKKEKFDDYLYVYVWSAIGAVAGAKVLYVLIDFRNIITAYRLGLDFFKYYISGIVGGGFVFYGGLIGGLITLYISSRYFELIPRQIFTFLIPAMPLAHAFGRIGCYMVGCCYGVEIDSEYGVMYEDSLYAPNGITLFPVQLVEAGLDILIFAYLFYRLYRLTEDRYLSNTLLEQYLFLYATVRFILEFFRGDSARGSFLYLSTSQWISIAIILVVVGRYIHRFCFSSEKQES